MAAMMTALPNLQDIMLRKLNGHRYSDGEDPNSKGDDPNERRDALTFIPADVITDGPLAPQLRAFESFGMKLHSMIEAARARNANYPTLNVNIISNFSNLRR
jgi:hypothetical protein